MTFGSSLTEISLLILVNVVFVSNYFFIRKMRSIVDTAVEHNNDKILKKLSRTVEEIPLVRGIGGFLRSYRNAKTHVNEKEKWTNRFSEVVYAIFMGKHKMAPCEAKRLPGWEPIPYKIGIVSTSLSLLFVTFLLSDHAITGKLAVATSNGEEGFCTTEDAEAKLEEFNDHIRSVEVTNIGMGILQYNEIREYRNLLLSGTSRYGYNCHIPTEYNEDFCNPDGDNILNWNCKQLSNNFYTKDLYDLDLREKNGEFYPGYCRAAAEYALTHGCTTTKRVCIDDWGWSILCKKIQVSVPCSPTWQGEIDEDLQAREVSLESDASVDNLGHLDQKSVESMEKILHQIDIAGSLYSLYLVVALFFPTPMNLYRPSLTVLFKRIIFGAGKIAFMVTVLSIYWGAEYLVYLLNIPAVQIFLNNLMRDPCFLDAQFIRNRTQIVNDVCVELIDYENKVGASNFDIERTIEEITIFDERCGCPYPASNQFIAYEMNQSNTFGFETWTVNTIIDYVKPLNYSKYQPMDDFQFIGNETICIDSGYARDEILIADETGLSWWEIWISSGLLAALLIKIFIANFGISLVKLADPLCIHNGEYESPPEVSRNNEKDDAEEVDARSHLYVTKETTNTKAAAFRAIASRSSIFWGFLTNMCLFSLIIASVPYFSEFKSLDIIFSSIIFIVCILGPCGCFYLTKYAGSLVEDEVAEANVMDTINEAVSSMVDDMVPPMNRNKTGFEKFIDTISNIRVPFRSK